jgi:hypothetical protein
MRMRHPHQGRPAGRSRGRGTPPSRRHHCLAAMSAYCCIKSPAIRPGWRQVMGNNPSRGPRLVAHLGVGQGQHAKIVHAEHDHGWRGLTRVSSRWIRRLVVSWLRTSYPARFTLRAASRLLAPSSLVLAIIIIVVHIVHSPPDLVARALLVVWVHHLSTGRIEAQATAR